MDPITLGLTAASVGLNYYQNAQMRKYNRQENDRQWQRMLDQWNRENAYNDPRQVLSRMKDAGVNPALAYMNGASFAPAANSPTPSADQGQHRALQVDPMTFSQIRLNEAQAKDLEMSAEVKGQKLSVELQNLRYVGEHIQELMNTLVQERLESQSRIFKNQEEQSYYYQLSRTAKRQLDLFNDTYEDVKANLSAQRQLTEKELDTFDERFKTTMDTLRYQGQYYFENASKAREEAGILAKTNQHWYTLENNKVRLQNSEIKKRETERKRLIADYKLAVRKQNFDEAQRLIENYLEIVQKEIDMVNAIGEIVPF